MADRTVTYRFKGDISNLVASMTAAGAAVDGLDDRLDGLDASSVRANRSTSALAKQGVTQVGTSARKSSADIDRLSGRLQLLIRGAVGLGPALIPIGASLVPAISGLAAGFGAAAGAAGTAMLAFNGVGDSLSALNAYQLDPTTENLEKLNEQFDALGPAGESFVLYLDSLSPILEDLQRTAGSGLFPGMESGLRDLITLMPQVTDLVGGLAETMGELSADAGSSLANDSDWQAFFEYLQTDAAPTLDAFGRSLGNFVTGLANMMTAFAPLTRDFANGMLDMSRSFREWAAGLGDSESFQEFIDYIRESGPQVSAFMGALADAVVAVTTAFAPWGSVVLPVLTATADLFATIAGSPIGPTLAAAASAFALFGRRASTAGAAVATAGAALPSFVADADRAQRRMARLGQGARLAAGAGGMLLLSDAVTQTDEALGALEGAAGGAMIGFSVGGPWGAAIGGAAGLVAGLTSAISNSTDAVELFEDSWDNLGATLSATGDATEQTIRGMLAGLRQQGGFDFAEALGFTEADVANALSGPRDEFDDFIADLRSRADELAGDNALLGSALKISIDAIEGSRNALDGQRESADADSQALREMALSVDQLTTRQQELHRATLANIDSGTAYGQSLADMRKQMKKGTEGFSRFTKAGRANREAVSSFISAYNNQSTAVKNSLSGYRRAQREIRKFGEEAGLTEKQIRMLQRQVDKPKKLVVQDKQARDARITIDGLQRAVDILDRSSPNINIRADNSDVVNTVADTARMLNAIPDETVVINVVRNVAGMALAAARADGGPVYGPGTATSDSIPAMLSNGEFVVRTAAVEKYGTDFMHAINSMRLATGGPVQGLANGGQPESVQTSRPSLAPIVIPQTATSSRRRGGWDGTLTLMVDGAPIGAYIAEIADGRIDANDLLDSQYARANR